MADFSQGFMDDLGPLGAIWAGRNQGMAENTSMVNQQNTLEQIANSQQTRQFNAEKHPFEIKKLEHEMAMNPLRKQELELKNKETQQKINGQDFKNMVEELFFTVPQLSGSPADAAVLSGIAKKNNLDPADGRIARFIDMAGKGDVKSLQKVMEAIATQSPEGYRKKQEHGFSMELEGKRGSEQRQTEGVRIKGQKELEQMRIDAGKYNKASTLKITLETELLKAKTAAERYQKLLDAATVAKQMADQADDPKEKTEFLTQAQDYLQRAQVQKQQADAELQAKPDPTKINTPGVAKLPPRPGVNLNPQVPGLGGNKPPPAPGPTTIDKSKATATKQIGNKTYYQINGNWYTE